MLFYTYTSYVSIKSHSYICGWKAQSMAMAILAGPQRARGTAKQPCCSDISHLTSSSLLLRYLGKWKKLLWAEVALQSIIKIAQSVTLLSHFQKNKIMQSSKNPCTAHNLWCLTGAGMVTNWRRAAWPGCSWDSSPGLTSTTSTLLMGQDSSAHASEQTQGLNHIWNYLSHMRLFLRKAVASWSRFSKQFSVRTSLLKE